MDWAGELGFPHAVESDFVGVRAVAQEE